MQKKWKLGCLHITTVKTQKKQNVSLEVCDVQWGLVVQTEASVLLILLTATVQHPRCHPPPHCRCWGQIPRCSVFLQEVPRGQKKDPCQLSFPDGWGVKMRLQSINVRKMCCITVLKNEQESERIPERHLGLKLDLWPLLTLGSAGLNGQGDLLPTKNEKIHTMQLVLCGNKDVTILYLILLFSVVPSSFCLEKGERLGRFGFLSELT